MKNHISKTKLVRYSLGFSRENERAIVEQHIRTCKLCKSRLDMLFNALKPADNCGHIPGSEIRSAVLIEARKLKHRASSGYRLQKTAAMAATALSILCAGAYLSIVKEWQVPVDMFVLKPDTRGSFNQIHNYTRLHEGSTAETDITSAARLNIEGIISIKLLPATKIQIGKTHKRLFGGKIAEFTLKEGSILAEHSESSEYSSITYRTDKADFTPLGTVFILSADDKAATLILKEGKIRIDVHSSGDSILAAAGNVYRIAENNSVRRITDSEKNQFSDFFNNQANPENIIKPEEKGVPAPSQKHEMINPDAELENHSNDHLQKPENHLDRKEKVFKNQATPSSSRQNKSRYRKGR